ncbi:MAG TPA: hypothetical protein VNT53_00610 [Pseudolysinimonas sp.]|nr:hypothetical protein [Pseudolysinimonas sp.]
MDTWLVMRSDPVLPAAIILRLRNPDGSDFFVTVRWDLNSENRRMIGRYRTLQEADAAVLYDHPSPIVPVPGEEKESLHRRQEVRARELEAEDRRRRKLYSS